MVGFVNTYYKYNGKAAFYLPSVVYRKPEYTADVQCTPLQWILMFSVGAIHESPALTNDNRAYYAVGCCKYYAHVMKRNEKMIERGT